MAECVHPLPALATGRSLGPGAGRAPVRRRCPRRPRLEPPLARWHDGARPSPCGGGQKGGGDQALGRSRGGWGTKLHLRTDRAGKPVTWTLTAGQRHEVTQVEALLECGAVRRPSGQTRIRPARVVGDKGYTGARIRRYLRRRGIGAVIPRQRTESRRGTRFDRAAYRERNRVERTINHLKRQHRAIATRYEKLKETYHALITIAAILLWLPV